MRNTPLSWSRREKAQVAVVGAAPAFAVALLALTAAPFMGPEVIFLAIAALPLAYGTLFLCVFPALSILRRVGTETLRSFVITVAGATFALWALILGTYLLTTPSIEHPPTSLLVIALGAPTTAAALTAAIAWLLAFRREHAA